MPDSITSPATLSTARPPDPLDAAQALAWCWPDPGPDVVGFGYAVDRAAWFRLGPTGPIRHDGTAFDLHGVYELVAFDADRELRWLLATDGVTTTTVVLAESTSAFPTTAVAIAGPDLYRLPSDDEPHPAHLLAEHAAPARDEAAAGPWARLSSRRYDDALVPYRRSSTGERLAQLALAYVEYVHEDDHGNLTVKETRLTGVRAATSARQPAASGEETS